MGRLGYRWRAPLMRSTRAARLGYCPCPARLRPRTSFDELAHSPCQDSEVAFICWLGFPDAESLPFYPSVLKLVRN